MGFELIFDTGADAHLGSATAWGGAGRWIDNLPRKFKELHRLRADGVTDHPDEIEAELADAMELSPPGDSVCSVLAVVRQAVRDNPDANQMILSSGA